MQTLREKSLKLPSASGWGDRAVPLSRTGIGEEEKVQGTTERT